MVEEKTSKKKQLILAGVGLLFLLVLVIGATYAYFAFTSQNDFKDPATIEGSMGALGGVSLTKAGDSTLTLNLSAADMLKENAQTYYASGSSTPKTIATVKVTGGGRYNCTYTLEVTKTATSLETDMYERFQNGYAYKSTNQIYFNINNTKYDFNTAELFDANGKLTYSGTLTLVSSAEDINLTANMVIVNASNRDQTYLNGTDISITINATDFNCELIDENAKAEITSVKQLSVGANGVQIQIDATDVYGIDKYYYSVNGSEYTESVNNTYTFTGLDASTTHSVSVYATNVIGNESDVKTETYNTRSLLSDICNGNTLSDCLLTNGSLGLQTDYSVDGDDLYRFAGSQRNTGINNYICLGADTCTSGSDNMYRIIGVNPETKEIKVIKQTKLSITEEDGTVTTAFMWGSFGKTWENSNLYSILNTTWLNSISFADLIIAKRWNIGDVTSSTQWSKSGVLTAENKVKSIRTAKVGALSLTDYYLAHTEDKNWNNAYNDYSNWILLWNNGNFNVYEWAMSRRESGNAWNIAANGHSYAAYVASLSSSDVVRPTFFLTSELQYVSGEGTVGSPFIVQAA